MQSILFVFRESDVDICRLFKEAGFRSGISENNRLIIEGECDYISVLPDNGIIKLYDEHELQSIPFEIGSVFLYEFTSLSFGKNVLETFLQYYLKNYPGNNLCFDMEKHLYPADRLYNKLYTHPDWDWRS